MLIIGFDVDLIGMSFPRSWTYPIPATAAQPLHDAIRCPKRMSMARHPQDDVTKEFIKLVVEERVRNSQRDVDLPEILAKGCLAQTYVDHACVTEKSHDLSRCGYLDRETFLC